MLLAFCSHVFAASFENTLPSSPDEVASLSASLLIDGFISPLSGQISLCETDLHVKGAQDLHLKRTYVPPQIYGRYEDKDNEDRFRLGMALLEQESRRWAILSHLWAGFNNHSHYFQVRDPNGFVLEFELQGTRGILKTSSHGLSNLNQGQPDGAVDLRNIEFSVEPEGVRITWPDSTERYYQAQPSNMYRLEKELLPNGKAIRYEYDGQKLVRIVSSDPNGKYTYGVIEKIGDSHYVGSDGREVHFDYETKEVKGKVKNGKTKRSFSYSTALLFKASNPTYTHSIQYNDRTLLSSYDAKAYPVSFDYSKAKGSVARVERFSTPSGSILLSYDPPIAGQKEGSTTAIYSDGARVIYRFDQIGTNGQISYTHRYNRYDEAGRILAETHLQSATYVFNAAGRQILKDDPYLTEKCSYDPIGNLIQKNETLYGYDPLSQITSESGQFTARYDARYNRIEKNGSPIPVDTLNQIETEDYDINGNLIRPGFVYDAFNQLIEAGGERSVYDALGRRIQRGPLSFLYIKEDEIGAFEHGRAVELQIPGYNKAVGIEIQERSYLPIHDVQGTVRCLVDWKTGEIYQQNPCDVFGAGLNPKIPYAYAGKRYDPQTELYYFGQRYYDPNLSRWLTTDPIGPSDHANLYQYIYNNPFQYGDPSGTFAVPFLGMAFGAGLSFTPIGWAILGITAVSYATVWSVQKMTENGTLKPDYAPAITSLVGGITGSMIHTIPQSSWSSSTGGASSASPYISEFGYIPQQPGALSRNHVGSVDPSLPANPDDLAKKPGWEETTHPDAGKAGHRTFENSRTSDKLRHDKGDPEQPGHEAHDHYHRPNPNKTGKHDQYLDANLNPVPKHSPASHIYAPENVWWN